MRKICLLLLTIAALSAHAKKIRFAVDMGTHTVSPNGIHVMGDFQVLAGLSTMDWQPGDITLAKEGTSSIFSVVLDLPAFRKYEYKFVNGDQSYEAEFVPDESRVGYNFNDNRWIYLDSLTNDTSFAGAIRFGENAPAGKFLIRYLVDLSEAGPVSPGGVHAGASYQANPFDPSRLRLYSFGNGIYEVIDYVNAVAGTYSYIFFNGNTVAQGETVPSSCGVSGKRSVQITGHTVLTTVCFSSCSACTTKTAALAEQTQALKMYPNPAKDVIHVKGIEGNFLVRISDQQGRILFEETAGNSAISTAGLESGVYTIRLASQNHTIVKPLIIQR